MAGLCIGHRDLRRESGTRGRSWPPAWKGRSSIEIAQTTIIGSCPRITTGHAWDSRLAIHVSDRSDLEAILQFTHDLNIAVFSPYHFVTYNCTDAAIEAAGIVGVALGPSNGRFENPLYPGFGEEFYILSCPAVFGQDLLDAGGEQNPAIGGL